MPSPIWFTVIDGAEEILLVTALLEKIIALKSPNTTTAIIAPTAQVEEKTGC